MDYKRRLATAEREISGLTVAPRSSGYPLTRAALASHQARWILSERLSPEAKAKVPGALGRLRSVDPPAPAPTPQTMRTLVG